MAQKAVMNGKLGSFQALDEKDVKAIYELAE